MYVLEHSDVAMVCTRVLGSLYIFSMQCSAITSYARVMYHRLLHCALMLCLIVFGARTSIAALKLNGLFVACC